jgi:hypothetical protein
MLRGLQHTPRWPYRSLALASQRSTMAAAEPIHRRTEPQHKCRIYIYNCALWGRKLKFLQIGIVVKIVETHKTYYLYSISLDTSQCCGCCSY